MTARPTLHVLDGTAALFRAWFSVNARQAPDGTEVGAVWGLGNWLAKVLRRLRPTYVAVVFDAGTWTFRNEIWPDYKANRGEPPEELLPQFDLSLELCAALGCPAFRTDGYEADDLMAALTRRGRAAGLEVALLTPDKDVLQLVTDGVYVIDPKELTRVDETSILKRFGVTPGQLVDYMALAGDPTDNVPGVPGVGPKSAQALIAEFGSLDALYEGLDRVPELEIRGAKSLATKLETSKDEAELSRRLVRLDDEAPLNPEVSKLGDLRLRVPEDASRFFDRVGFMNPTNAQQ